jgi:hypothetical protein
VLRKLKQEDHHVFGTFSIRFQPKCGESGIYRHSLVQDFYSDRCCIDICNNMMEFTDLTRILYDVYEVLLYAVNSWDLLRYFLLPNIE